MGLNYTYIIIPVWHAPREMNDVVAISKYLGYNIKINSLVTASNLETENGTNGKEKEKEKSQVGHGQKAVNHNRH